jgi:hypothetical protein
MSLCWGMSKGPSGEGVQMLGAGPRRKARFTLQPTYSQIYCTWVGFSGPKTHCIWAHPRKLQTGTSWGRQDAVWRKASYRDAEQWGDFCCGNTTVVTAACLYWSQHRQFNHAERIEFQKQIPFPISSLNQILHLFSFLSRFNLHSRCSFSLSLSLYSRI